jgi:hypothetical protein
MVPVAAGARPVAASLKKVSLNNNKNKKRIKIKNILHEHHMKYEFCFGLREERGRAD